MNQAFAIEWRQETVDRGGDVFDEEALDPNTARTLLKTYVKLGLAQDTVNRIVDTFSEDKIVKTRDLISWLDMAEDFSTISESTERYQKALLPNETSTDSVSLLNQIHNAMSPSRWYAFDNRRPNLQMLDDRKERHMEVMVWSTPSEELDNLTVPERAAKIQADARSILSYELTNGEDIESMRKIFTKPKSILEAKELAYKMRYGSQQYKKPVQCRRIKKRQNIFDKNNINSTKQHKNKTRNK